MRPAHLPAAGVVHRLHGSARRVGPLPVDVAPSSKYSPEFREESVQIALRSSKTISETARELGLNPETLRGWVKKHEKENQPAAGAELTVSERARLKELERRNREARRVDFNRLATVRKTRGPSQTTALMLLVNRKSAQEDQGDRFGHGLRNPFGQGALRCGCRGKAVVAGHAVFVHG